MLGKNMQEIFRKYISHKIVASRYVEKFLTKIQEKRQSNLNIGKRLKQILHQSSTYKDAHYHQWFENCKLQLHRCPTTCSLECLKLVRLMIPSVGKVVKQKELSNIADENKLTYTQDIIQQSQPYRFTHEKLKHMLTRRLVLTT